VEYCYSNRRNREESGVQTATVTITDDESAPTVSLTGTSMVLRKTQLLAIITATGTQYNSYGCTLSYTAQLSTEQICNRSNHNNGSAGSHHRNW
jgi:hypothetical protein